MTERRWAWVEVDTNAIRSNVRKLKSLLPADCRFMAVVKADGYGHGALQVARAALGAGADALGVATLDEGVALRQEGVTAPMQVLAEPPASTARLMVAEALVPTVVSREFAVALSEAAERAGRVVDFHLKVDTGMNRIGVQPEDADDFLFSLTGLPGLRLVGVMTHLATAEIPGDWDFGRQMERFGAALEAIREAGFATGIVHAANSAAAILHPEARFDMVRCGISVYGLHPGEATRDVVELVPAMAVKARLVSVKEIGMGEGVSYGFTWRAAGPTTIATVPLGYADGLHRTLSDRMEVLVGGRRCAQVGRICMDQFVIEVPRGVSVRAGDEVVLVGEQDGAQITLDEIAERAGTINYETACAFGMRLERRCP